MMNYKQSIPLSGRALELAKDIREICEAQHRELETAVERHQEELRQLVEGFQAEHKIAWDNLLVVTEVDPELNWGLDVAYTNHGVAFLNEHEQPVGGPRNMAMQAGATEQ